LVRSYRRIRAFTMLVRDLDRVAEVVNLVDSVVDDKSLDASLKNNSRHEQGRRALEERPRLGRVVLSELAALPANTLGRVYADHMIANALDPATMPTRATRTPREYIVPHLYETHDIWHVVTGFGTDVPGELGLQGFYTAQSPSKGPMAILTAGMLNTLIYQIEKKDERIQAVAQGWVLGRRAKPLFGVRWNELWNEPIDAVRARFSIDIEGAEAAVSASRAS
jgi:ubiquinone biosynthesis protein COQ4